MCPEQLRWRLPQSLCSPSVGQCPWWQPQHQWQPVPAAKTALHTQNETEDPNAGPLLLLLEWNPCLTPNFHPTPVFQRHLWKMSRLNPTGFHLCWAPCVAGRESASQWTLVREQSPLTSPGVLLPNQLLFLLLSGFCFFKNKSYVHASHSVK
jgi:hypothetical protein